MKADTLLGQHVQILTKLPAQSEGLPDCSALFIGDWRVRHRPRSGP